MSYAEIEFHFLKDNFDDSKPQDPLARPPDNQTITPASKCAYKGSGRD
jgi:hypothetical protein